VIAVILAGGEGRRMSVARACWNRPVGPDEVRSTLKEWIPEYAPSANHHGQQ
jgi:hypothetical protein